VLHVTCWTHGFFVNASHGDVFSAAPSNRPVCCNQQYLVVVVVVVAVVMVTVLLVLLLRLLPVLMVLVVVVVVAAVVVVVVVVVVVLVVVVVPMEFWVADRASIHKLLARTFSFDVGTPIHNFGGRRLLQYACDQ